MNLCKIKHLDVLTLNANIAFIRVFEWNLQIKLFAYHLSLSLFFARSKHEVNEAYPFEVNIIVLAQCKIMQNE